MSGKWVEHAKATHAAKAAKKTTTTTTTTTPGATGPIMTGGSTTVASAPSGPRANNNNFARGGTFFKKPAVIPRTLTDFAWADVLYLPMSHGKLKLVPLRNPSNGPMCIKITGGGTIPQSIGLKPNDFGKLRLTMTFDKIEEHKAMDRLHSDATSSVMNHAHDWFKCGPEVSFNYATLVGRMLSEVKPKKEGGGEWPRLGSVNINPDDLYSTDNRADPDLLITTEGDKRILNLVDVLGQRWTSMIWELQFFVIGYTKPKDGNPPQPQITISRRLRKMHIVVDENHHHIVFPEDREIHDKSECKQKHTRIESLYTFSFREHANIAELLPKVQSKTAYIDHKLGGEVIVELTGGGILPPFVIDQNREGKCVLTVSVDSPEDVKRLDVVTEELRAYVVSKRGVYFPKSDFPSEVLGKFVKRILGKQSEKHPDYSRCLSTIIEADKLGTTVRIVDAMGQNIDNPGGLAGKKWSKVWIALRSIYQKVTGDDIYEIGLSKRFVYLQLQHDMRDYALDDGGSTDVVAVSEPNSKRQRTDDPQQQQQQ